MNEIPVLFITKVNPDLTNRQVSSLRGIEFDNVCSAAGAGLHPLEKIFWRKLIRLRRNLSKIKAKLGKMEVKFGEK